MNVDFMQVIDHALNLTHPYTVPEKYISESLHLGFFDPNNFKNELNAFCKSEHLTVPSIPETLIPEALPILPDGIFISSHLMTLPDALMYAVISSVFHLFFIKHEYDGNIDDILMDYPEVSEILEKHIEDLMQYATDTHRIVLYRRIGYTLWSAFLSDYMAQVILLPDCMTTDDIMDALDAVKPHPSPENVAELAKTILGCPEYMNRTPDKKIILKDKKIPFAAVLNDIVMHLNEEKYYRITPDYLCRLGRNFEADLIRFEKHNDFTF